MGLFLNRIHSRKNTLTIGEEGYSLFGLEKSFPHIGRLFILPMGLLMGNRRSSREIVWVNPFGGQFPLGELLILGNGWAHFNLGGKKEFGVPLGLIF